MSEFVLMPKSPSEAILQIDGYPRVAFDQYQKMLAATPVAAPTPSGWISVDERLPEVRDAAYQVVTCAKKTYGDETNYPGQGIKGVNQDWVVRQWPGNFAYWMPLPAVPQVPA